MNQNIILTDDETFDGNPNLKKPGVSMKMTPEQISEYVKCKKDPVYFIENYVKFLTLDMGATTVKLYPFQKDLINLFHKERKVICKLARQVGKSSTTTGYILHYLLFNKDKTIAILAQKEEVAKELLTRLKVAYENIPIWMQQGIKEWNKKSIVLETGSRVMAGATSGSAIRGYTINLLVLDEFAIVQPHIQEEFFTAVYPTISSGTTSKIFITSTPKGLNLFYKLWTDAEKEKTDPKHWNGFKTFYVPWDRVPGRDKKWADEQRKALGEAKYQQEVETEFLGSANTLIRGHVLRNLAHRPPILSRDSADIYDNPVPGHAYCIVADPSEGKGLDYSTFTVFDITEQPYRVVAKFRDNTVESLFYAYTVVQAAKHYNDAYVVVENNSIGALVLHHILSDLEYDNIFYTMSTEHGELTVAQEAGAKTPGVKTTKKVKTQGCVTLKTLVENQQIVIDDFDMISELSTFVLTKNKSYQAEPGYNDDLCSNLWLFAWLTLQGFFKDISDLNLRAKLFASREAKMSEMMPAQPVIASARYAPQPKIEKDTSGNLWLPAGMQWQDTLDLLGGFGGDERNERLLHDPFFNTDGISGMNAYKPDADERKKEWLDPDSTRTIWTNVQK